jgi:hypothetical protein
MEVGLEVKAEKSQYKLMYCRQSAGLNRNIKRANNPLKMWCKV